MAAPVGKQGAAAGEQGQKKKLARSAADLLAGEGAGDAQGKTEGDSQEEVGGKEP